MAEIHIIVASDRSGAIGRGGDLLYHLRADMRHFRKLTMGNSLIMGRRTFESLPGGALPGRRNIVLTRNRNFSAENVETAPDLATALKLASTGPGDIYIIGGGQIYAATAALAEELDLTIVDARADDADTFLRGFDLDDFEVRSVAVPDSEPAVRFITLRRRHSAQ